MSLYQTIKIASLTVLSAALIGCAAKTLKPGADRILVTRQPAPQTCRFVGTVIGEQGGALTGGWTSNKNLAQGAMNDMKNQALDMGANYVVLENTNAGNTMNMSTSGGFLSGGSSQTDVTHTGNAYVCPDEVLNPPAPAKNKKS